MTINIFKFGSCRASIAEYSKHKFCYNHDCTHSTKEIIQYLDFFDNIKNCMDCDYPNAIMNNPEGFDYNNYKDKLEKCDIVYIEISALNLVKHNNYYLQLDRYSANRDKMKEVIHYTMTNNDVIEDLKIIENRIQKPIILQGHINLQFTDVPNFKNNDFFIKNRQDIDTAIKQTNYQSIIIGELFKDIDYKEICAYDKNKNIDTYHLSVFAYSKIGQYFDELVKKF